MSPQSCFYEGEVRHRRTAPVRHQFRYRLFFVYVDLDELPTLVCRNWVWSASHPSFAWFRRRDHFGPPEKPLCDSVRDLVSERIGRRPSGPIRLLTQFRYGGFQMNPVSFFYCFDDEAKHVDALVAEVNNTPWNERHCYVLDLRSQRGQISLQAQNSKEFHVSPFLDMRYDYHWRLNTPGEQLLLQIELHSGDQPFEAWLALRRVPFTSWQRTRMLIRFPFMTLQIFLGIYWQALRLWWKRVPVVPHPDFKEQRGKPQSERSAEADLTSSQPQTDLPRFEKVSI